MSTPTQGSNATTAASDTPNVVVTHRPIRKVDTRELGSSLARLQEPLGERNWVSWRERMTRMLKVCGLLHYVDGSLAPPDREERLEDYEAWEHNDSSAQLLIVSNISEGEMIHVSRAKTAREMWLNLVAIHESTGQQYAIALQRRLFHTCAQDDDDINEHLTKLKQCWEQLNMLNDEDFRVTDTQFKTIIASSLPQSWDTFLDPYIGRRKGIDETDPRKRVPSQELLGIIREEYTRRMARARETTYQTSTSDHKGRPLVERLRNPSGTTSKRLGEKCKHCGKGHSTEKCWWLGKSKCRNCGCFGHDEDDCWEKKGKFPLKRKSGGDQAGGSKRAKMSQEVHVVKTDSPEEASQEEEIALVTEEQDIEQNEGYEYHGFNNCTSDSDKQDERLIYYKSDWLADSATTSHVANSQEAFVTYKPLDAITVSGVGNKTVKAVGRGTIELRSEVNGHKFVLKLEDVLHIPNNPHNLLSLGRWDKAGGKYQGGNGMLMLATKDGKIVAKGTKVSNNLYKMNIEVKMPGNSDLKRRSTPKVFSSEETAQSWEIWHRRFGHMGYSGLKVMLEKNLVDGFTVDEHTPQPDCVACTEAKQHIQSFPKEGSNRPTRPGELTHTDLWGKYPTRSIGDHQYYISFVDDSTRYVTVKLLKRKDEAVQCIKEHLTYLRTQGKSPRALRADNGKEYSNDELITWCRKEGIEIQFTAPYSPSQNGVAERLNRTLIELARAMMDARKVPEFLWDSAVLHATYIRNRAYTKSQMKTPYELWYGERPNVSHLREFGTPVWVLLQGQNRPNKLQPKSSKRLFLGYDDGSKAIKYFNSETRRIMTSRNFRFLTPPSESPPEPMAIILHDAQVEGEREGNALRSNGSNEGAIGEKRKRNVSDIGGEEGPPRKLRDKARINYRYLNDPFPDEEKTNEVVFSSAEIMYNAFAERPLANDQPKTLQEAKRSPEWPEWEKAIKTELEQLKKMGTWELVTCPDGAVPIACKWVFTKKYNNQGELVKYKARLVAKGYAQRPGHDYNDTFAPVVRLETIRAILAMVPKQKLKVQQMDVKGAYLNGRLQEKVYMCQPEGYSDGTDRVCKLIKTLYGLKQSGREWNKELDRRLKERGFTNLLSDPCAYICRDGENFKIITVWVDDLLLFTPTESLMISLKKELSSILDLTDIGEPSKIVGIEINQRKDSISISQKQYILNLLQKEGMDRADSVSIPMDTKVKLEPNPEGNKGNKSNSYASLIGALQYLATATRPDIAFAVHRLAAYTSNPTMAHYTAVKRILRYLSGTRDYGITYHADAQWNEVAPDDLNTFYGYADAAFANNDDHRSTSGYVFLANGGAITWGSRKQTTIALSSTEAEYVAISEASREAIWLRHLYGELGFIQTQPILLLGDNDGSIAMAKNPQYHKRTKHVDIRWHWVRDLVQDGLVKLVDCRDPHQTADILTKPLVKPKYEKHVKELGLSSV